jgi:hypothetical protein
MLLSLLYQFDNAKVQNEIMKAGTPTYFIE